MLFVRDTGETLWKRAKVYTLKRYRGVYIKKKKKKKKKKMDVMYDMFIDYRTHREKVIVGVTGRYYFERNVGGGVKHVGYYVNMLMVYEKKKTHIREKVDDNVIAKLVTMYVCCVSK